MRIGLRPQLLVLVAVLLGIALVPLFWTATTISRVSIERTAEGAAYAYSQSIAQLLADGRLDTVTDRRIAGTWFRSADGTERAAGQPLPNPHLPDSNDATVARFRFQERLPDRRLFWSCNRGNAGLGCAGVSVETAPQQARSFVSLFALYMALFGLGLLLAIHLAVTWLIVRPLDALGRAARRVAFGGRELELPQLPATELLTLGESLRTMTAKLLTDERELRHRFEEIHLANERLKQAQERLIRSERLASVGRLAAGLAHEVGNPIAAMLGLEELLLVGGLTAEEEKDFHHRIHRETERIHRILRDLLDFARPTRSAEPDVDEPGEVALAVSETFALVRPQKAFKQLLLEAALDPVLPPVPLSRPKLVQILLNLLLNAADALGEDNQAGRIEVRATAADRLVTIAVSDNGPGVASSIVEHLFEPFVTTKEIGRGTGLGLAVCRGLVESAGGAIRLDTSVESGARFVIELPAYAEVAPVPPRAAP